MTPHKWVRLSDSLHLLHLGAEILATLTREGDDWAVGSGLLGREFTTLQNSTDTASAKREAIEVVCVWLDCLKDDLRGR